MPIYAYKCESCGHRQDVLQRMSDAPMSVCPACGASSFVKQVTAAGFQLKGSGWYVTDFRGGNTAAPADKAAEGGAAPKPDPADAKPTDGATTPAAASTTAPAAAPSAAPAAAKVSSPSSGTT